MPGKFIKRDVGVKNCKFQLAQKYQTIDAIKNTKKWNKPTVVCIKFKISDNRLRDR